MCIRDRLLPGEHLLQTVVDNNYFAIDLQKKLFAVPASWNPIPKDIKSLLQTKKPLPDGKVPRPNIKFKKQGE